MWRGGRMLCVIFLLTVTLQLAAKKACSKDIIASVETLINSMSNLTGLDSSLYTPTTTDYSQKCPRSTLMCFAEEAKVLVQEWEDIPINLTHKLKNIAQLLKSELDCPQCELYTERDTEQFLEHLLSVLGVMNTENCPKNHPQGGRRGGQSSHVGSVQMAVKEISAKRVI